MSNFLSSKVKRLFLSGIFAGCILQIQGCATPTLTVVSNEKANLSLVDFEDSNGEGELIGQTPATIDLEKFEKKYIRVWGEGIQSQYWVVSPLEQDKNELSLRIEKREEPEEPEDLSLVINQYFRMLMRSYKALTAKRYETARDLAKQLNRAVPEAAAPHLITGLSYLGEGEKSKARTSFLKAKNLDPEDKDIESLLNIAKD